MVENEMADRVSLITGGTSGIGEATAAALVAMGVTAVITSRSRDRGEATLDRIRSGGGAGIAEFSVAAHRV